jgi:hypothetical protein
LQRAVSYATCDHIRTNIMNNTLRYMVRDRISFDEVACVELLFPDTLSAEELADVEAWFALRVRVWKRKIVTAQGSSVEAGEKL